MLRTVPILDPPFKCGSLEKGEGEGGFSSVANIWRSESCHGQIQRPKQAEAVAQ